MKKYNVAIIGATGNVGREMLSILEQRDFPVKELYLLASSRSEGKIMQFRGEDIAVQDLAKFDFSNCDIALSSPGAKISADYSPKAAAQGCVVIDNTSYFRTDKDVPLIVPEVNPEAIKDYKKKNIIANPNCSTIQMLVALKPIYENFGIKRVVVSTYQAVSGAGQEAIEELKSQTSGNSSSTNKFPKQIAHNVIPHIDVFMENGATKEEWKMEFETAKILCDKIKLHANCARVPVINGHAEYINVETEKDLNLQELKTILENSPGICVIDKRENAGYSTQLDASGKDEVFISRIREDSSIKNGLSFWCVSDNLRKGAALNTIQIAELLIKDF